MNLLTDSETAPALAPIPAGAEPVILIENVSVRYRIPREHVVSIKDYAIRKVKGKITFDEFWALKGVSLSVQRGEVLAVIGENGAGKSTLMKILAGVQTADSGEILLDGQVLAISSVHDALATGIALIHQELNLADNLDVAANIFLGREPLRAGLIDRAQARNGEEKRRSGAEQQVEPYLVAPDPVDMFGPEAQHAVAAHRE